MPWSSFSDFQCNLVTRDLVCTLEIIYEASHYLHRETASLGAVSCRDWHTESSHCGILNLTD